MPKGNPNPSPATRFSADNPGRAKQKGARDRLSAAFLTDFADDYEANGKAVIETVRDRDPIAYMRIAAALLPTKVEITENPLDCLSDEQLDAYMEEMNNGLLERAAKGDPKRSSAPAGSACCRPHERAAIQGVPESAGRHFRRGWPGGGSPSPRQRSGDLCERLRADVSQGNDDR
jgi:hypothetical protein